MVEILFEGTKSSFDAKVIVSHKTFKPADFGKLILPSEAEIIKQRLSKQKSASEEIICLDTGKTKILYTSVLPHESSVKFENLGGKLYQHLKKCTNAVICFTKAEKAENAYALALGIELGSYGFDKYFTKKDPKTLPVLENATLKTPKHILEKEAYKPYLALKTGIYFSRDITNEPSNHFTPVIAAEEIKRLGYLGLEVDILDEEAMRQKEFNLALSVAQGSANKPRIAIIKWRGNPKSEKYDFGLVGKGVTFDSGGISLKPGKGMWEMKADMAGAAAVAGALKTIALQKLKCNVVGVVGMVENMPSGTATRPGDVVRSMSGQTVEILNTDAEGRLVLADCLWYIQNNFEVSKVVDIATLTGAIVVALGSEMAGIMGNNSAFVSKIQKLGETCGEKVWPLPLLPEYNKLMDSSIADMKNISEVSGAGSITAACFLERFIKKGTTWAHLDIAGMDLEKSGKPTCPKGATGFGVKLFNALIKNL